MRYSNKVNSLKLLVDELKSNAERLSEVAEFVDELCDTQSSLELYQSELESALTDSEIATDSDYCNDLRKSIARLEKNLADLKAKQPKFDTYLRLVFDYPSSIPDVA